MLSSISPSPRSCEAALVGPACGQQGQLVDRQRPRSLLGGDERGPQRLAGMQALECDTQVHGILRPAERERSGHGLLRMRSEREQQRLIGDLLTRGDADVTSRWVDRLQASEPELEAALGGDPREREALRDGEAERLGDGYRPVTQLLAALRMVILTRSPARRWTARAPSRGAGPAPAMSRSMVATYVRACRLGSGANMRWLRLFHMRDPSFSRRAGRPPARRLAVCPRTS